MLKLYRRENEKVSKYHEAWVDGSKVIEHWGVLGDVGSTREHSLILKIGEKENVERVLATAMSDGFEPIDLDDHTVLLVEYPIEGIGNTADLDKRHALEDRLNETLGWSGLGHCDGGSIGSGTMEVCCYVVDFETAKRVIEKDLEGTKFADCSRIYHEGAGYSALH
jgi:hypothetical protein